ncbi:MAG TPA: M1 family metallopeptidase, partial [Acidobacteriota bacterium]|nr:M1 family metallopeptidase [Acidobacteriota bacterium]
FRVSNVQVNGAASRTEEKGPFLRIYLNEILRPQRKAVIEFDFVASLPPQRATKDLFTEAMDELLRILKLENSSTQDYGVFGSSKDILNLGLWYAALAKYEESGWDEQEYSGIGDVSYFDPSDFQVRITAPANYKVVTTGSIVKRIPSKQGKIVLYSQSKMTRDFEVELSARFEELTRIQNRVIVRSFFLPEHAESGKRVLDSAVQALEYYEKNFGPYPYTELDVVEAPLYGGAGGVEFPGIVTISSMLYRDVTPDAQDDLLKKLIADNPTFDQLIEFVVAHEVAHQWWNAVVGSNSKQFPFIDEAMANYSAILYFEHYYGRQAAENQMALQMKVNYQLHRLLGGSDQPVQQPASSFKGALEYSAIVYGKGALYFDHLRSLIGDAAFFA